jgi:predicted ATPase/DNA-binding CsgD family transcriptional regulator
VEEISPREAEVLELVGEHLTNTEIAERLFISIRTVESHVSSLLRKLDQPDRRSLAALAADRAVAETDGETATTVMAGAPESFTSFIGRRADLDAVTDALHGAQLVTLTGPGGIGKTRLAVEVGRSIGGRRSWFVDLVPATPTTVVPAIARVLAVDESPDRDLLDVVIEQLGQGEGLVVLDNCEHLLEAAATTTDQLLRGCPDLSILVTSREPLGLPGERVLAIASLPVDEGDQAATMLFRERAGAAGATLDEGDAAAIAELCRRLDGLPLAIELAAARCASLGVDDVLRALDDRFSVLGGSRVADPRHRSLRAVLDWSYGLLDDDEQRTLRHLSIFNGGFRLVDAAAVAEQGPRVTELVGRLVDKSLVAHSRSMDGSRYRLLETVRAYASELLDDSGERDLVAAEHLRWALDESERLEAELVDDGELPPRYDLMIDDFRTALHWAGPVGKRVEGHELARRLAHLAYARRFVIEARLRFMDAAELAADDSEAAIDLLDAGDTAFALLQGEIGFGCYLSAAAHAERGGDNATAAIALARATERVYRMPAEFSERPSAELIAGHMETASRLGHDQGERVAAHLAVAEAWISGGEAQAPDMATAEKAVRAARAVDDPVLESSAMDALSAGAWAESALRESVQISLDRVELLERMRPDDPRAGTEQIDIVHMASDIQLAIGDLPRAVAWAERSMHHPLRAGALHMFQRELVVGLCLTGRFDEAIANADEMRAAWERIGRPPAGWMAPATNLVYLVHGLRGETRARDEWNELSETVTLDPRNAVRSFAIVRLALHEKRFDDIVAELERREEMPAQPGAPFPWSLTSLGYDPYLWATVADAWAAHGEPDALVQIEHVRAVAPDHLWAAPCLDRAEARITGDDDQMRRAAAGFAAIDARFEQQVTLALLGEGGAD